MLDRLVGYYGLECLYVIHYTDKILKSVIGSLLNSKLHTERS